MHSINVLNEVEGDILKLEPKNQGFGRDFLIITDVQEFLKRFRKAMKKHGFCYVYDFVHYADLRKYTGIKSVFKKDLSYEYQKEFRIFIRNDKDRILRIELGDMSDITELFTANFFDSFSMKFLKQ